MAIEILFRNLLEQTELRPDMQSVQIMNLGFSYFKDFTTNNYALRTTITRAFEVVIQ